jgi:hypothetical protein
MTSDGKRTVSRSAGDGEEVELRKRHDSMHGLYHDRISGSLFWYWTYDWKLVTMPLKGRKPIEGQGRTLEEAGYRA